MPWAWSWRGPGLGVGGGRAQGPELGGHRAQGPKLWISRPRVCVWGALPDLESGETGQELGERGSGVEEDAGPEAGESTART